MNGAGKKMTNKTLIESESIRGMQPARRECPASCLVHPIYPPLRRGIFQPKERKTAHVLK